MIPYITVGFDFYDVSIKTFTRNTRRLLKSNVSDTRNAITYTPALIIHEIHFLCTRIHALFADGRKLTVVLTLPRSGTVFVAFDLCTPMIYLSINLLMFREKIKITN